jgi:hypothetical protein
VIWILISRWLLRAAPDLPACGALWRREETQSRLRPVRYRCYRHRWWRWWMRRITPARQLCRAERQDVRMGQTGGDQPAARPQEATHGGGPGSGTGHEEATRARRHERLDRLPACHPPLDTRVPGRVLENRAGDPPPSMSW